MKWFKKLFFKPQKGASALKESYYYGMFDEIDKELRQDFNAAYILSNDMYVLKEGNKVVLYGNTCFDDVLDRYA